MYRRIIAGLVGVLSLATALTVAGLGSADASDLGSCKGTSSTYTCVKVIKHLGDRFAVTGSDGEDNTTPQQHTLTCSIKKTSSLEWGMSMSASVEMKAWIFSKVTAQVGGHFVKSHSTETDVTTSMPVPAHTTVMCYRGAEVKTYRVRKCVYTSHSQQCATFRWHAPLGLIWRTTEQKD